MKLPSALSTLFGQKQEKKEVFASLLLDVDYVATALWDMGDKGVPHILAATTESVSADTWEDRLNAVDDALATVEDKAGTTVYAKTVLGLPLVYLTETGEITKDIRAHIKEITKELELKPIGFVSIHQALMYKLKKDEGVPPSVIFLGISHHDVSLSLYKVGALSGQKTLAYNGDIAIQVEELLKQFKDLEVLPARILLYGHDGKDLTEIKSDLLKYPWTTRVNFLHFPKIEIVTPEEVVSAVSLAGASELASEMKEEVGEPPIAPPASHMPEETIEAEAVSPIPQNESEDARAESMDEVTLSAQAEAEGEAIEEGEAILHEEKREEQMEESNVVVVDPSRFGFQKNVDVLEKVEQPTREPQEKIKRVLKIPKIDVAIMIARFRSGGILPIIGVVAAVLILGGLIYWNVPHANVTVLELPTPLSDTEQITIDPTATIVDAQNKIIPGAKQQQSVSEDKTLAVTGKKNVGDPAKGSVTIYNKNVSSNLPLKKGTVLSSGSLQFTLDADIDVASAATTISDTGGSTTFGTASVNVTASQIGPQSNMPSGTAFVIKGYSEDAAVARNPAALSGGTSKEVTVVTRADYDALVAAAQKDLVDQAKQGLTASVGGMAKLIEDTIQTTVTQKTFAQELDQEATQLSGKVTVTVTGISYNDDDIKTLLKAFIAKDIPQGFTLSDSRTQVSLDNVIVKKDGKITATVTIKADAVPTVDITTVQKKLAGKSIADAEKYLRGLPGIAGMEVSFGMNFGKSRLPMKSKNITVKLVIQ